MSEIFNILFLYFNIIIIIININKIFIKFIINTYRSINFDSELTEALVFKTSVGRPYNLFSSFPTFRRIIFINFKLIFMIISFI